MVIIVYGVLYISMGVVIIVYGVLYISMGVVIIVYGVLYISMVHGDYSVWCVVY
jgi:hypothetical protein